MLRCVSVLESCCALLFVIGTCVFPVSSYAQQFQRLEGTDYFLVLFPDASVALGLDVDGDIQFVSETEVLEQLKKQVVTDKKIVQRLNALLRGKSIKIPNSKLFKTLKKLAQGARDGLSGKEKRKVLATRRRLSERRVINLRAIEQIEAFFRDKTLPPIDTFRNTFLYTYTDQGVEKWVFGVYVGFNLPKEYEDASSALVCAAYSGDSSEPHRGDQMPFESEETITNDPCVDATLFGDVSCPGAYGKGVLGSVLSSSNGTGSGPSATIQQSVVAKSGSNFHQFRYKLGKTKCKLRK